MQAFVHVVSHLNILSQLLQPFTSDYFQQWDTIVLGMGLGSLHFLLAQDKWLPDHGCDPSGSISREKPVWSWAMPMYKARG